MTSDRGDLQVSLPPWLAPFDTSGAIFANEVIVGGAEGIELIAEGPDTAEPQPGTEGAAAWLERRMKSPGSGVSVRTAVELPSGESVRIERVDRAGTPSARRLDGYAISTSFGTAYLLIDGTPGAWAGHEADLARIAPLVRLRPGREAATPPQRRCASRACAPKAIDSSHDGNA